MQQVAGLVDKSPLFSAERLRPFPTSSKNRARAPYLKPLRVVTVIGATDATRNRLLRFDPETLHPEQVAGLAGGVLNGTRMPEKLRPGNFDYFFNSHQVVSLPNRFVSTR